MSIRRDREQLVIDTVWVKWLFGLVSLLLVVIWYFVQGALSDLKRSSDALLAYPAQMESLKTSISALSTQLAAQTKDFQEKSAAISTINTDVQVLKALVQQIQAAQASQGGSTTVVTAGPPDVQAVPRRRK